MYFNGPLRRTQSHGFASIKIDLTDDEILVLEKTSLPIQHFYSDKPTNGMLATCYAFEEVVAEKIRALAQRVRPRDLYDVIHFYRFREAVENRSLIVNVLHEKCAYKSIDIPTIESIASHPKLLELEPQWENMLGHQLPSLPPISSYWDDLSKFFAWLEGDDSDDGQLQALPTEKSLFFPSRVQGSIRETRDLHRIQFAAVNRVCIKLGYHGRTRTVEPLSFRRSKEGTKFLFGFERDERQLKSFALSKIESIEVTNKVYRPSYPVEIGPGPIHASRIRRRR